MGIYVNPDYKHCATCSRLMSADDAHRRCQPCRGSAEYQRRWRASNPGKAAEYCKRYRESLMRT